MKFDMKKPCAECPFRKGPKAVRLRPGRVQEIINSEGVFACHKTVDYSDGDGRTRENSQGCVGFMVFMDKARRTNQAQQVGIRLGIIDPAPIDNPANRRAVVDSADEIVLADKPRRPRS